MEVLIIICQAGWPSFGVHFGNVVVVVVFVDAAAVAAASASVEIFARGDGGGKCLGEKN